MLNGIIAYTCACARAFKRCFFIILYLFVVICYCHYTIGLTYQIFVWYYSSYFFYSQFSVQHIHPARTNCDDLFRKKWYKSYLNNNCVILCMFQLFVFYFIIFEKFCSVINPKKKTCYFCILCMHKKIEKFSFCSTISRGVFVFQKKKSSNKNTYLIYFYFLFHFYHFPFPYFRRQVLNVITNNSCLMFQFICEQMLIIKPRIAFLLKNIF